MSGKLTRASVLLFSTGLILTLVIGCATSQRPAVQTSPDTPCDIGAFEVQAE